MQDGFACAPPRAYFRSLGLDPQQNTVKAHPESAKEHYRCKVRGHKRIDWNRQMKAAISAGEVINHRPKKHVHQPTSHFVVPISPRPGRQTDLGYFFAAKWAAIQACGHWLPAKCAGSCGHPRTKGRSHTFSDSPSLPA